MSYNAVNRSFTMLFELVRVGELRIREEFHTPYFGGCGYVSFGSLRPSSALIIC